MGIIKKLKKHSFWSKVGAAVCAAALIVVPMDGQLGNNANGSSSMQSIQDQISQLQKENEERKKQIEKLGSDIADNEEAMGVASDLIDGINAEITANG